MSRLADPARIAALQRSGLVGRPLPERLERLVATAASVCHADLAQMNVLDESAQHHLSTWPPIITTAPVPLRESGCQYVVDRGITIAVPDTLEHPVLCDASWATLMRSYLGTPVEYDGQPIGSLCVLTREPRAWHRADKMALESVARLVSHALV